MNTITKIEAFTPFTATRKAMIRHIKGRLVNPENRPTRHPVYGNKYQALFLEDYAVYAALRGADFKKTSHMADGQNAKEAIEYVIKRLASIPESKAEQIAEGKNSLVNKFIPIGASYADVQELKSILEQALSA